MTTFKDVHCVRLTTTRLPDYLKFFETRAFTDNPSWASCYCYFPIHDPKCTKWREQTAESNRRAIVECIGRGATAGFLAYHGQEVVGWCNAGPWSMYPMLHGLQESESDRLGVIFCFVVAPEARRQGVASALLQAACDGLREQGMTAVQAKPLKSADSPAANHLGPLSMYLAAGFQIVREGDHGDVWVRKSLCKNTR